MSALSLSKQNKRYSKLGSTKISSTIMTSSKSPSNSNNAKSHNNLVFNNIIKTNASNIVKSENRINNLENSYKNKTESKSVFPHNNYHNNTQSNKFNIIKDNKDSITNHFETNKNIKVLNKLSSNLDISTQNNITHRFSTNNYNHSNKDNTHINNTNNNTNDKKANSNTYNIKINNNYNLIHNYNNNIENITNNLNINKNQQRLSQNLIKQKSNLLNIIENKKTNSDLSNNNNSNNINDNTTNNPLSISSINIYKKLSSNNINKLASKRRMGKINIKMSISIQEIIKQMVINSLYKIKTRNESKFSVSDLLIKEFEKPKIDIIKEKALLSNINQKFKYKFQEEDYEKRNITKISSLLKQLPGFMQLINYNGIDDNAILAAAATTTVVYFENEEIIFQQGDKSDCFYGVLKGKVKIVTVKIESKEINNKLCKVYSKEEIDTVQEGHCFGEWGLIENKSRSASAIAISKVCLFKINSVVFEMFFRKCLNKAETDRKLFLKTAVTYFDSLPVVVFNSFFRAFKTLYLKKGDVIIDSNIVADSIFIVYQGECVVRKRIDRSKSSSQEIIRYSKGNIFGLEALDYKKHEFNEINFNKEIGFDSKVSTKSILSNLSFGLKSNDNNNNIKNKNKKSTGTGTIAGSIIKSVGFNGNVGYVGDNVINNQADSSKTNIYNHNSNESGYYNQEVNDDSNYLSTNNYSSNYIKNIRKKSKEISDNNNNDINNILFDNITISKQSKITINNVSNNTKPFNTNNNSNTKLLINNTPITYKNKNIKTTNIDSNYVSNSKNGKKLIFNSFNIGVSSKNLSNIINNKSNNSNISNKNKRRQSLEINNLEVNRLRRRKNLFRDNSDKNVIKNKNSSDDSNYSDHSSLSFSEKDNSSQSDDDSNKLISKPIVKFTGKQKLIKKKSSRKDKVNEKKNENENGFVNKNKIGCNSNIKNIDYDNTSCLLDVSNKSLFFTASDNTNKKTKYRSQISKPDLTGIKKSNIKQNTNNNHISELNTKTTNSPKQKYLSINYNATISNVNNNNDINAINGNTNTRNNLINPTLRSIKTSNIKIETQNNTNTINNNDTTKVPTISKINTHINSNSIKKSRKNQASEILNLLTTTTEIVLGTTSQSEENEILKQETKKKQLEDFYSKCPKYKYEVTSITDSTIILKLNFQEAGINTEELKQNLLKLKETKDLIISYLIRNQKTTTEQLKIMYYNEGLKMQMQKKDLENVPYEKYEKSGEKFLFKLQNKEFIKKNRGSNEVDIMKMDTNGDTFSNAIGRYEEWFVNNFGVSYDKYSNYSKYYRYNRLFNKSYNGNSIGHAGNNNIYGFNTERSLKKKGLFGDIFGGTRAIWNSNSNSKGCTDKLGFGSLNFNSFKGVNGNGNTFRESINCNISNNNSSSPKSKILNNASINQSNSNENRKKQDTSDKSIKKISKVLELHNINSRIKINNIIKGNSIDYKNTFNERVMQQNKKNSVMANTSNNNNEILSLNNNKSTINSFKINNKNTNKRKSLFSSINNNNDNLDYFDLDSKRDRNTNKNKTITFKLTDNYENKKIIGNNIALSPIKKTIIKTINSIDSIELLENINDNDINKDNIKNAKVVIIPKPLMPINSNNTNTQSIKKIKQRSKSHIFDINMDSTLFKNKNISKHINDNNSISSNINNTSNKQLIKKNTIFQNSFISKLSQLGNKKSLQLQNLKNAKDINNLNSNTANANTVNNTISDISEGKNSRITNSSNSVNSINTIRKNIRHSDNIIEEDSVEKEKRLLVDFKYKQFDNIDNFAWGWKRKKSCYINNEEDNNDIDNMIKSFYAKTIKIKTKNPMSPINKNNKKKCIYYSINSISNNNKTNGTLDIRNSLVNKEDLINHNRRYFKLNTINQNLKYYSNSNKSVNSIDNDTNIDNINTVINSSIISEVKNKSIRFQDDRNSKTKFFENNTINNSDSNMNSKNNSNNIIIKSNALSYNTTTTLLNTNTNRTSYNNTITDNSNNANSNLLLSRINSKSVNYNFNNKSITHKSSISNTINNSNYKKELSTIGISTDFNSNDNSRSFKINYRELRNICTKKFIKKFLIPNNKNMKLY